MKSLNLILTLLCYSKRFVINIVNSQLKLGVRMPNFSWVVIIIACFFISTPALAQGISADEIMKRVDSRPVPKDMKNEITLKLIDKNGRERARIVETIQQGTEKQIMWFLSPADVRGTSFLSISQADRNNDMWLYLPAFKKVRRIVSSAKKESFMGSDFTYKDLEERNLNDYTYKLLKEENLNGSNCYVVESIPKSIADTEYSKIISWVWKERYLPIKEEYYDKNGKLLKIKTMSDIKEIKGYRIPGLMTMENVQKQHKTEITFSKMEVDTGVRDDMFNVNQLQKIR